MIEIVLQDIASVVTLAFLEMLLSADNAVVLGVVANSLPVPQRRKALFIGLASAFVIRAAALLLLSVLLDYLWIRYLGAAYLLYLSFRYFVKRGHSVHPHHSTSFWKTVLLIEALDVAFALDSILAGVAFINADKSKLWIVYVGGMIGLVGMRYAAEVFSRLLDRYPRLERSAYLMVGWIGIELGASATGHPLPHIPFWIAIALLFLLGFFPKRR
jgi:YkoY family integral membrane protein